MNKGTALVCSLLRLAFKPKPKVSAVEWIPRNVRLSPKSGNRPGLYSLNHTPFFKAILEDVDNPRVTKVIIQKSAQIGASILSSSIIVYLICNFTIPLGYFLPSAEQAKNFSERALGPSIENCQAVKPFLTGNDDDITKTSFQFKHTAVKIVSSGSPSKLSSQTFGVIFCDEIGKYRDYASAGETNALALAEARTESYGKNRKVFVFSTPTNETSCQISKQFKLGSQSKFFVPCPHCQHKQELVFQQIRWPKEECKNEEGDYDLDKVASAAFYECEHCKGAMSNEQKIDMVRKGEWRATNPKPYPAEIKSYHISNLYSLNHTFGNVATRFLLAGKDPSLLQDFYNNVLGLPFEQRAATIKRDDLNGAILTSPIYKRGQLLAKPDVILMGIDTQGSANGFWWAKEAIYADGTSSLIDWGQAMTFEDLKEIFKRTYPVINSLDSYAAHKALIDMGGDRTEEVKAFCVSSGFLFVPVIGRVEKHGLFAPLRETNFSYKNYQIAGLIINDKTFKDILYLGIIKEHNGKLFFPADVDDTLATQLTGSQLVTKKNQRGQLETFWKEARNVHLGDALKYLEAFKYYFEPRLAAIRLKAEQEAQAPPKREYTLNNYVPANSWD